ncbi:hypothetical protein ABT040_42330 [Streptomyces sp. NPDC002688]|uniref:hypothetical protein n=1 Tax=Streptomyces sp. NPDC002688 TaxID=3154423 RepID=UPI0033341BB4
MASNEIRFDRQQRDDLGVFEVVPRIDGIPLTELIDTFEIGAGMRPAGDAYGGLIPQYFRFGPMDDHFHGQSTDSTRAKTPVLGCACGDWGCWPLKTRITVTADLVIWDSFEQPHRTTRDYTRFGPFQFDRHQYDDALRALSVAIGSDIDDARA